MGCVDSFKRVWIYISFVILFGASVVILAFNGKDKYTGFGIPLQPADSSESLDSTAITSSSSGSTIVNNHPDKMAKSLYEVSTALNVIIMLFVLLEIVMRAGLSACLVYPCELQERKGCCVEYYMPTFWKILLVLTVVTLVVEAALTGLIIAKYPGTDEYPKAIDTKNPYIDFIRLVVLCGLTLIQVIVTVTNLVYARHALVRELAEDEEVVKSIESPSAVAMGDLQAMPTTTN